MQPQTMDFIDLQRQYLITLLSFILGSKMVRERNRLRYDYRQHRTNLWFAKAIFHSSAILSSWTKAWQEKIPPRTWLLSAVTQWTDISQNSVWIWMPDNMMKEQPKSKSQPRLLAKEAQIPTRELCQGIYSYHSEEVRIYLILFSCYLSIFKINSSNKCW